MTPLSLKLKPSRNLAAALAAAHLAALACVVAALDAWPLGLSAAGIVLSGVATVGETLLAWPGSPVELQLNEDGSGRWTDRRGGVHAAAKVVISFTAAWLVVVGLRGGRFRTRWLVVPADAATREDHRRLRLWSRWRTA